MKHLWNILVGMKKKTILGPAGLLKQNVSILTLIWTHYYIKYYRAQSKILFKCLFELKTKSGFTRPLESLDLVRREVLCLTIGAPRLLAGGILEKVDTGRQEKKVTIQDKLAKFNEKGFWCPKPWSWNPSPGIPQVSWDMSLHPVPLLPCLLRGDTELPRLALHCWEGLDPRSV